MKHILFILVTMVAASAAQAQFRLREASPWDRLYTGTSCLAPAPEAIELKPGYVPQATLTATDGWIDFKTGQATENPWTSSDPQKQAIAQRNQFAFNMDGGGRCPRGLGYRWSRNISWKRENGETVTVNIARTHQCKSAAPSELFSKQKVTVNIDPRSAKTANPNKREQEAIINEGLRLAQVESNRRLDNSELKYPASVKSARDIAEFDATIGGYLTNRNCAGGNSRTTNQETAAARFCQTRQTALQSRLGTLTEMDRQCPAWLPRTIAEITTASRTQSYDCGQTSIMPNQGQVSKCPIPPGFTGQVGLESNGCRILSLNDYPNGYRDVSISCTPGTIPRLPGSTASQAAPVARPTPAVIAPARTGAK